MDRLSFKTQPDYNYCRGLFSQAIRDSGYLDDKLITFDSHAKLTKKSKKVILILLIISFVYTIFFKFLL